MSTCRDYFDSTLAKDIMMRDVVTVFATEKFYIAAQILIDHGISGAPVVSSGGTCLGVFSTKDFPKRGEGEPDDRAVLEYMSPSPITVPEDQSLRNIVALMSFRNIHRILVVDDMGKVAGIISSMDIVHQINKAMNAEANEFAC